MKICIRTRTIAIILPLLWLFIAPKSFGFSEDQIWLGYHAKIGWPTSRKTIERVPAKIYSFRHVKDSRVGLIDSRGVGLWEGLSEQKRLSVLRHEIAHQFLEQLCLGSIKGIFLHEVFAQWISGDYSRIAATSIEFAYGHLAASWLRENNFLGPQSGANTNKMSYAIARIILEKLTSKRLEQKLIQVTKDCVNDKFNEEVSAREIFFEMVESDIPLVSPKLKPDIFIIDALSLEPVFKQENQKKSYGSGSILKPLLIGLIKELRLSVFSTSSPYWRCGASPSLQQGAASWTWVEALIKSCNGFFLEHKYADKINFDPWINLLNQFGIKHDLKGNGIDKNSEIMLKSIGLIPGIEVNIEQVSGLYRWLFDVAPDVIYSLLKTPLDGTLAGHPRSRWFIENSFALKTGTVRAITSEPLHGWIVAVGPLKNHPENPPVIAVVHGVGHSPQDLLKILEESLKKTGVDKNDFGGKSQVQVLGGLVRPGPIRASCAHQLYRIQELPQHEKLGDFHPKTVIPVAASLMKENESALYTCYLGPLSLAGEKSSKLAFSYYGRLRVDPLAATSSPVLTLPVSARRAGARLGSPYIIETSLHHYVNNVISNEYPEGYKSTLQALALAIALNSQSSRHEPRPLCDTSHCQIFGSGYPNRRSGSDSASKSRAFAATQWALDQIAFSHRFQGSRLVRSCSPLDWYPFALGGNQPWKQQRLMSHVSQALSLASPLSGIKFHKNVEVSHPQGVLTLSCEIFRNQLKLPSCPELARILDDRVGFEGRGEGHGLGISLVDADLLAAKGTDATNLFRRFFPQYPRECIAQDGAGG